MDIGVRALKEHLSDYLDRAARGEIIVVTDRGQPKAVLGPVPGKINLDAGIADRWIRPGNGQPARPVRRARSSLLTRKVLREDRGE